MTVLYVLAAIVIMGVIVVFHELGHYIVGRVTGMGILEFSVGFGPKIFGFRRRGIDYSLRCIPLGGYCKFLGEDEKLEDPRAMRNQKVWKRFLTVAAGPVMNFVLALLAAFLLMFCYGQVESAPVVGEVSAASPAMEAGLQVNDIIQAVDGTPISYDSAGVAHMTALIGREGKEIELTVLRGDETLHITLTPVYIEEANTYRVGISLGWREIRYSVFESLQLSGRYVVEIGRLMLDALKGLITRGEGLEDTMGPVGIISFVSQEVKQGFDMVLYLIVIISLNLGIINLLPFPGLDGARLLFLVIEGIRRKPIDPNKEGLVHAIGLLLLFGFVLFVTYKDILRLFTGG